MTLAPDPSVGGGRGIVALVLTYVLLLQSLPLAPLVAHVLRQPDVHHCMHAACACRDGRPCAHHTGPSGQQEAPALQSCGTPATAAFVLLSLDKALLPSPVVGLPEQRPPRRAVGHSDPPPFYRADDVFHPPRAA